MQKMNKKADVSIALLVLMTLLLVGATLFVFNINMSKIGTKVVDSRVLDSVYVRENEVNFYVNEILDNVAVKGKEDFVNNFKQELEMYKYPNGDYLIEELGQVEEQIDKIRIEDNKVIFDLSFPISRNFDDVKITYSYKHHFEKDL